MAFPAKVYQVLIASPGDVPEDREAIRNALHAWNEQHAKAASVVFLPSMWELHALPRLGDRAQAIINEQIVDPADFAIAAFHTRVGTPTGAAESGAVEEIQRCLDAGKKVAVYFSGAEASLAGLDLEQLSKLRTLKQNLQARGLLGSYNTAAELHQHVERQLWGFTRSAAAEADGQHTSANGRDANRDQLRLQKIAYGLQIDWTTELDSGVPILATGKDALSAARSSLTEWLVTSADGVSQKSEVRALLPRITELHRRLVARESASTRLFWVAGERLWGELVAVAGGTQALVQPPVLEVTEITGRNAPYWRRGRNGPELGAMIQVENLSPNAVRVLGVDLDLPESGRTRVDHSVYARSAGGDLTELHSGSCELDPSKTAILGFGRRFQTAAEDGQDICLHIRLNLGDQEHAQRLWFMHRK